MTTSTSSTILHSNSESNIDISYREKQIIELISLEFSDREIAVQLFLSHHTMHSHRKKLMLKFDVRKSIGLVRKGFKMGILL